MTNSVVNRERDSVIDITKAFGIIFMVLGHIHFSDDIFNKYVYAFHMPLFFIVSGMLFNDKRTIREMIKTRVRSLLIPYSVFLMIYGVIYIGKCLLSHDWDSLKTGIETMLLFPTNKFPFESAMWFLPVMFLTNIGYTILRRFLNIMGTSIAVLLIGIIGLIFPIICSFRLPWGMDSAYVALLFFHTGFMIKHFAIIENIRRLKSNNFLMFLILFIVTAGLNIWMIFINEKVNLRTMIYGNPVLTFLNAVLGTMIWYFIADALNGIHPLAKVISVLCRISELSIVYLCINHNALHLFKVFISGLFSRFGMNVPVVETALIFVFSMALIYLIGTIIDKTNLRVILGRKPIYERI